MIFATVEPINNSKFRLVKRESSHRFKILKEGKKGKLVKIANKINRMARLRTLSL